MTPASAPSGGMSRGRRVAHHAIYACFIVFMAACLASCGMIGAPQPMFTARGRVVDPEGRVVPGAVVTDGQGSVLTDDGGRFALPVFERALSIAKPGHAVMRAEAVADRELEIRLAPRASAEDVALDGRWAGRALGGLRAVLDEAAGGLVAYPGTPLARLEALVMVTPGAVPAAERSAIAAWVRGGGRLILCGEWGGYPDQDLGALNDLAGPAGLAFTGSTVKPFAGPDLALSVPRATPASLGTLVGDGPLTLYAATDLEVRGAARPILASGPKAYAVLEAGRAPVLAAVGPSGLGKVFAIGDSSLWRDEDSEGRGVPNVKHGGNARLAAALLAW